MLSSIGLPGLNGFVGEFLILLGAFKANIWAGGLAVSGVVLGAVYMLHMVARVIWGPLKVPGGHGDHSQADHGQAASPCDGQAGSPPTGLFR